MSETFRRSVTQYSAHARALLCPEELRAVSAITHELGVLRVGIHDVLADVLGPLRELLEADSAGTYAPCRDAEGWALAHARFIGAAFETPKYLGAFMRRALWRPAYDMDRPEPGQRNRAVIPMKILDAEQIRSSAMWREVLVPMGSAGHDHLRVLVCDGPVLLGWVGALREEPFTAREQRRLAALSAALLRRMRAERRLQDAGLARAGLEAALDAMAVPAFILRGNSVLWANDNGRAAFDADASLARALVEGTALGFETTPIAVRGAPAARLLIRSVPSSDLSARVSGAARAWKLTPRQAKVLELVACADSNKLIAAKLGCALRTVELHVSALLRKAGCASRAELVARLARLE